MRDAKCTLNSFPSTQCFCLHPPLKLKEYQTYFLHTPYCLNYPNLYSHNFSLHSLFFFLPTARPPALLLSRSLSFPARPLPKRVYPSSTPPIPGCCQRGRWWLGGGSWVSVERSWRCRDFNKCRFR